MKIREQVLSIEQMKHLQELGVDTSDASMCWLDFEDNEPMEVVVFIPEIMLGYKIHKFYPTYSIGDLIEKLSRLSDVKGFDAALLEIHTYKPSTCFGRYILNNTHTYMQISQTLIEMLYYILCWIAETHKEVLTKTINNNDTRRV